MLLGRKIDGADQFDSQRGVGLEFVAARPGFQAVGEWSGPVATAG